MTKKYDVVISGVAGLFPECDDFEELIAKLLNGVDLVTKDDRRWTPGAMGVPHASGKLKDPEEFDIGLFGIPRKLVEITDPTTRLSVMQGFRAVCDAGVNPNEISGSNTAVLMSSFTSETEDEYLTQNVNLGTYGIIANARAMQANRLSFFLNLKGPSNALDSTWCGGVQALQYAHDLISTGQVKAAIVGSCSLLFKPQVSVHYQAMGRLCQDGVTRSFSADASGYARSEACVTMFLQRAQDARRCYATLLGAKAIHRGMRPNYFLDLDPDSLEGFLRGMYKEAGVNPKDVAYYEACGSASRKLDAKELNVAAKVFLPGRSKPLLVGSIKSNLGHTEGASALVSLAKALIALDRGTIPPNLHYTSPNPDVPALLSGKMKVVSEPTDLDGDIVSLTDFGVSGTTVSHIIVKRNPRAKPPLPKYKELPPDGLPRLVLLSDRNMNNIRNNLKRLADLQIDEEFCCLLNQLEREGVKGQLYRAYSVLNGFTNSYNQIETFDWKNECRPVWFMFSGMGSQWPQMGKQLMRLPIFARAIKKCHEILLPKGIDLLDIITNPDGKIFDSILNCFVGVAAVQIGLVDVLREVGIKPDGMIGHSVGELGCGYADGCLSLEQMILSAYARGKASIEAPLIKGTMAAVGLGYKDIKDQLPESIDVACHNSNTSCTLSGPSEDMESFIRDLKSRNVFAKLVNVANIAYHSRYIKPAGPLLLDYLKPIIPEPTLRSSKWLSSSNPESQWETDLAKYSSAEYYTNNLLSAVLFEEVSRHVPQNAILIEIAPHGLLQAIVKRSHPQLTHIPLTSRFDEDNLMYLLGALGKLYVSGVPVDVQKLYQPVKYPVSRGTPALSPFVGWQNTERFLVFSHSKHEKESCWKDLSISVREDKYLLYTFHKIKERIILPKSYYLKKVAQLYLKVKEKASTIFSFESLTFLRDAEIPLTGSTLDIDLRLFQGTGSFTFASAVDTDVFVSGKLQTIDAPKYRSLERSMDALSRKSENYVHYEGKAVLDFMESQGYTLENKFAVIKGVDIGETSIKAILTWNGNMVAFLNGLLTLISFFHTKLSDSLYMVSEIQQLVVDFPSFKKLVEQDIEVFYDSKAGNLRCPGVLLFLPETNEVYCDSFAENLGFEVHRFVPYNYGEIESVQSAVSICHQLVAENSIPPNDTSTKIRTVCMGENLFFDSLSSINKATNQLQLRTMGSEQMLIDHEIPTLSGEVIWVVASKTISKEAISKLQSVAPQSFILMPATGGNLSSIFEIFTFTSSFEKYALYSLGSCRVKKVEKVNLSNNYLQVLESKLIQANDRNIHQKSAKELVYLIGTLESLSTILGVLDQTKNLPYYNLLRFFFGDGQENLDEYFGRMNNDLKMNVIWNGAWGTLKAFAGKCADSHLPPCNAPSLVYNLSDLVQSSEPSVLGVNFSDVTGSLDNDVIGAFDIANRKYMGIGTYEPQRRVFSQDEILNWNKPSQWTVDEAATVPLLYAVAMNIIKQKNADLKIESILVNEGLTLLSQAILQLLQVEPAEVYVTVYGEEEKKQLLKLFPKLEPKNIFYCTSTFHVSLLRQRGGLGVDKVVNTFRDPEMIKPCAYALQEFGTLIQVSLNPAVTKSTMGMLVYADQVRAIGISAYTLLKLPRDRKIEIRDALAEAINEGIVRPFARTSIPQESTNVEAIDYLKSAKAKVVANVDKRQDLKTSRIQDCSLDKNYVIVSDRSSKSTSWLELASWLVKRGARKITVVLKDTVMSGSNVLRIESLKHKYGSLDLTIKSIGELSSKASVHDFITAVDGAQKLDGVFILSYENGVLVEEINETLEVLGCKCNLVCFGYGGERTCENRNNRGLSSLCVRVGGEEKDFKAVMECLDVMLSQSQRNPVVTVKTLKAAESAVGKSHVPTSFVELQNLLHSSAPCCSFKEIQTLAPSMKYTKETNPLFLFPGLRPQNMRKITRKLLYPAYEVRLAKNVTSIKEMAKNISELMSSTRKNMYTLVAEGWGGILALHVAAALESAGKIVRLILMDAGPSDILEWTDELMKDPISLISKYIDVTYEEKLKVKNSSSWEDTVNRLLSKSTLSPNEKIAATEGLDLLRRRLQGVAASKPPTYKMQRPCYLFYYRSNARNTQHGLEEYLRTEAVMRVLASDTEARIVERVADEINALALCEIQDAANPPREDYLRIGFIKGKTKAVA